jgi:hypothetical protein
MGQRPKGIRRRNELHRPSIFQLGRLPVTVFVLGSILMTGTRSEVTQTKPPPVAMSPPLPIAIVGIAARTSPPRASTRRTVPSR